MSKRLTVEDWDDVADLCDQAADMVGTTIMGEDPMNTRASKDKASRWIHNLAMKAHCNARRLEAKGRE